MTITRFSVMLAFTTNGLAIPAALLLCVSVLHKPAWAVLAPTDFNQDSITGGMEKNTAGALALPIRDAFYGKTSSPANSNLDVVIGGMEKNATQGLELPVPEEFYGEPSPHDFNLDDVTGSMEKNTTGGIALPVPDDFYGVPSPFEQWYPKLPTDFKKWEEYLDDKFKTNFEEAGSPVGIRENDHNFDTPLGQGNTLGFVTAKLNIEDGPANTKYGLFAETGTFDAVLRFSDFGSDNSTARFARIALKLPLQSAWLGEVNLLFTETMDTFPIDNYGQLGYSLGGGHDSTFKNIWHGAGAAISAAWVIGYQNFGGVVLGRAFKKEPLAKNFYSQLPYQLGDNSAMKFQLISKQKTCGEVGADKKCCLPPAQKPASVEEASKWAKLRASRISEFLSGCDAIFELQLQVKIIDSWENSILHKASSSWSSKPIKVGTLRIPAQECDAEYAVNAKLQSALAEILEVEPQGVDKMFAFHPIATHKDNRPIGDVCTFRAGFYAHHSMARYDTFEKGAFKKADGKYEKNPLRMPFQELKHKGVF